MVVRNGSPLHDPPLLFLAPIGRMTRTHFIAFAYSFNYNQLYQYAVMLSINILNISPLNIRMDEELHSQK